MDQTEDASGDLLGLSLTEAADRVAARADRPDAETVRTVLAEVAQNRIVSDDRLAELVSDASMAVSNAGDRAEYALLRVEEIETAASDAPDLDTVAVRLESLRSRAESVDSEVDALTGRLRDTLDRHDDGEPLFEVVRELRDLRQDADALHGAAQQLATDADEFERWLDSHEVRVAELDADVGAIEESIADLEAAADALADPDGSAGDADPARRWFAAVQRQRLNGLVVADARAELADVRDWADREGAATADLDDLAERLADLDNRRERLGDRLEDLARPDWRDRYGEAVTAVESTLSAFDPPVDFGAVQAALEDHDPERR